MAPLGVACTVIAAIAIADGGRDAARSPSEPKSASVASGVAREVAPTHVRWLALGGGVEPGSNQVSIEQDLALVGQTLGPGGLTLFAGGPGRSPVQVLQDREEKGIAGGLHRRLGDLFWPQDGRDAAFRETTLAVHGDAHAETVLANLLDALEQKSPDPLFVFVAAHGEPGPQPNENLVRLWGGAPINVVDLTGLVEELPRSRPLRLVMATCFAGGFAEIAFEGADPKRGSSALDACGLFATTWDTEAAGCDPNPDRRAQESYLLHLMHALRGHDRHGKRAAVDLDGDGRISLLEAHARVRVASRSVSIPTSTSERWLRQAVGMIPPVPSGPVPELVEEHAVIAALSRELELDGADAVRAELITLEEKAKNLDDALHSLELSLDVASADLRIALLERWPVLDDPYHPGYAATLEAHGAAIRALLDTSSVAAAYRQAQATARRGALALEDLDVAMAMARRLLRAHENLAAAAELRDRGGEAFARYLKLLRCERTIPPLGAGAR